MYENKKELSDDDKDEVYLVILLQVFLVCARVVQSNR